MKMRNKDGTFKKGHNINAGRDFSYLIGNSWNKNKPSKKRGIVTPNEIEIINDIIKIKLSQDQFAIIDNKNFEKIKKYRWYANYAKNTKSFYPTTFIWVDGKSKIFRIHQLIHILHDNNLVVDHINNDTLNNLESNLQIIPIWLNCLKRNKRIHHNDKPTTSKYKGVSWFNPSKKWCAKIMENKRRIHLGYFENEIDAAYAYQTEFEKIMKKYGVKYITKHTLPPSCHPPAENSQK